MSKKSQIIRLTIIPMMFLITFIYSIIMLCIKSDSQNWYSFLGQLVLVAVWMFAGIGLKKLLRNKILAIVLANIIFQLLLFAHILIYLFSVMQATYFRFAEYLACGLIVIGFVAMLIMIYDLFGSVTHINLFRDMIDFEEDKVNKLNKILLTVVPILLSQLLWYGFIITSLDGVYITLNCLGIAILIGVWFGANLLLGKYLRNKKAALVISQIIFQAFLLMFAVCFGIVSITVLQIKVAGNIYQYMSLCIISISAIVILILQLKIKNIPAHETVSDITA